MYNKHNLTIFIVLLAFGTVFNVAADGHLVTGRELNLVEMNKIIGACGPKCLPFDQVCGFGVASVGPIFLTDCCGFPECLVNQAGVPWKCDVGFTNRSLCQGSYTPDPDCNPTASSIDCEGGKVCLGAYVMCNGCECVITGVALCGGIPYVTDCGQHANCDG